MVIKAALIVCWLRVVIVRLLTYGNSFRWLGFRF